jgi:hypothetical protein
MQNVGVSEKKGTPKKGATAEGRGTPYIKDKHRGEKEWVPPSADVI